MFGLEAEWGTYCCGSACDAREHRNAPTDSFLPVPVHRRLLEDAVPAHNGLQPASSRPAAPGRPGPGAGAAGSGHDRPVHGEGLAHASRSVTSRPGRRLDQLASSTGAWQAAPGLPTIRTDLYTVRVTSPDAKPMHRDGLGRARRYMEETPTLAGPEPFQEAGDRRGEAMSYNLGPCLTKDLT